MGSSTTGSLTTLLFSSNSSLFLLFFSLVKSLTLESFVFNCMSLSAGGLILANKIGQICFCNCFMEKLILQMGHVLLEEGSLTTGSLTASSFSSNSSLFLLLFSLSAEDLLVETLLKFTTLTKESLV